MDLSQLKIDRPKGPPAARSRPFWRWVVLLLIVAGLWWFRAPLQRFFVEARLPKVETVDAYRPSRSAQSAASGVSAGGYVIAQVRAALSSDVPGRIVAMHVHEGKRVQAGDVVARLAHDEQESRLRLAEANVQVAEAAHAAARARTQALREALPSLRSAVQTAEADQVRVAAEQDYARAELQRIERLRAQDLSNESELDAKHRAMAVADAEAQSAASRLQTARAQVTRGEADVAAAEADESEFAARIVPFQAQVDEAQAALEKTYVRAPFDGVVVLKDAEVGEVVSPNSQGGNSRGAVATLVDLTSLEAQVELPEVRIGAIREGGPAKIYLDAFPEDVYTGSVDRIWPTANRQKATVEVRVRFDRLDERVRPEMGLRVVFEDPAAASDPETPTAESTPPGIRIPERALAERDGANGVFVLQGDRVRWRVLESFERAGQEVELHQEALAEGDRVVLSPPSDLQDGDRVKVADR